MASTRRRAIARACSVLLVGGLLAAACGDDSGSSSATTGGGSATTAGGSATTAAPPDTSNQATGEPVKVLIILDESEAAGLKFDTARAGAEAKVAAINANGGLGGSGRPVQIDYCVSELDPNKDAQCARDAVADPSVIAMAASVIGNGDSVNPILEEAGLANVGSTAFSGTDGTSTISFPVMGGLIAATGCQATILADKAGAKKIGVAYSDTPGAELSVTLANLTLASRNLSVSAQVVTPVAKADVSAEVTSILDSSDAVLTASDGATAKKVMSTVRQLGSTVPLAGSGAQQFTPAAIKSLGDVAEGVYLSLWFATDDMPGAGVTQYLADLDAAGFADQSDDLAKNSWIAFDLLNQAATGLTEINRTTMLDALSKTSAYDSKGLAPVLDFTKPGAFLNGAQPRIVNTTCVYGQIQGGKIVALDAKFVNPFDPPTG